MSKISLHIEHETSRSRERGNSRHSEFPPSCSLTASYSFIMRLDFEQLFNSRFLHGFNVWDLLMAQKPRRGLISVTPHAMWGDDKACAQDISKRCDNLMQIGINRISPRCRSRRECHPTPHCAFAYAGLWKSRLSEAEAGS